MLTIKQLKDQKAALEAQVAQFNQKGDKLTADEKASLAKCTSDIASFGQQIETLEKAEAATAENATLRTQVALLVAKDREREIKDRVAKCRIPSFHADLEALYTHAVAAPDAKVKKYTVKDGKREEAEVTVLSAVDSLVAAINEGAKRLFSVEFNAGAKQREEGKDISANGAAKELDDKARERVRDSKSKDYIEAVTHVLEAEPELAVRYHEEQSAARQTA
jgi:hypothetical protein